MNARLGFLYKKNIMDGVLKSIIIIALVNGILLWAAFHLCVSVW